MRLSNIQRRAAAGFAMMATAAAVATSHAQTPVAHWTFDAGVDDYTQTIVADQQPTGGTSDAVWADATTEQLAYTAGKIGGAVRLIGTGDDFFRIAEIPEIANTIAIPDPPDLPVAGVGITVSAWINVAGTGNGYQGVLMSRDVTDQQSANPGVDETGQNWGLAYRRGDLDFDTRVSGIGLSSADGTIVPGQWHHIAMVWGSDDDSPTDFQAPQIAYLDGVAVATNDDTGISKLISSGEWLIGSDLNRNYVGLLDDFAIYDSPLTATQVASIASNGNDGINASGVATSAIMAGDVDGAGGVTIDDFHIIRDHLGQTVTARNLGDLDGSRKVDLNDFQQWLEAAPAALHEQALASFSASVPEPASVLLLAAACAAGGLRRRSRKC